ncbi:lysosomal protective protein-like [Hyla sarda]|uniref:lysosomal protective protein-like n=1 Tax=Hyla sarda TaxID=327740 RepID=UPI0024C32530|nr:lysosomal protective protein-like [Hyla sarda]XP_056405988.1 lysosomal protective protein-like [Hyla sarda]
MFPLFLGALLVGMPPAEAAPRADEIFDLPGLHTKPSFRQFSGFLKASSGKYLHYWFVECQEDPKSCPLVLWLNGGPGCSSLAGLLTEHGPFLIHPDGRTLKNNEHSWNKIANVLYLESPAGVGFSYSDDKKYVTGDKEVAHDNYLALKDFFRLFPEFTENYFYIAGESYGGFYVPSLAVEVTKDSSINLKGLAIGNGITDYKLNDISLMYFAYYHGLIHIKEWSLLESVCCKKKVCTFFDTKVKACKTAVSSVLPNIFNPKENIYNLYHPCVGGEPGEIRDYGDHIKAYLPGILSTEGYSELSKKLRNMSGLNKPILLSFPCVDYTSLTTYLNNPEVRSALHIPNGLPKWEICNKDVFGDFERELENSRDLYRQLLMKKEYRVLVYSGDFDMACNFLGIEWFVDSLNLKSQGSYHPWMCHDGKTSQISGYAKQYANLTILTVKGAGHMVPEDKPFEAFQMFRQFINNEPF